MSNYPPGVTGNEPQITGEWPCSECDGAGGDPVEGEVCRLCRGSGIFPEEAWPKADLEKEIKEALKKIGIVGLAFDEDDEDFLVIKTNLLTHSTAYAYEK